MRQTAKDHTTLVAAVNAAGLVYTLQSAGPFTVFVPANEAFGLLTAGTVDNLLKTESKATLITILTYLVVAGKLNVLDITKLTMEGNGKATVKTVAGGNLTFSIMGKKIAVKDEKVEWLMYQLKM